MKLKVNLSATILEHRRVRQMTRFGIQRHEPPAMRFPTVAVDVRELQVNEDHVVWCDCWSSETAKSSVRSALLTVGAAQLSTNEGRY